MSINTFENYPYWLLKKWQEIADLLAEIINLPAVLIMKKDAQYIEVFITSNSQNNPYKAKHKEKLTGLYCEAVIRSQKKLIIPNALKDYNWNQNPDIKLGMIAYLGFPINFPDGKPFGTICALDNSENNFSDKTIKLIEQFRNVIELDLAIHQTFELEADSSTETIKNQHKRMVEKNEELTQINQSLILAKEESEKHKQKYLDLYNNVPTISFSVDAKTAKIIECNKTACDILGYTKEEMLNKIVFDLYLPEYAEHVRNVLFPLFLKTGFIHNQEAKVQKKSGEVMDILINVNAVRDQNNNIIYTRSNWQDITKLKQIEKELIIAKELAQDKEEKYRLLADNLPTLICEFLPDSTLTFVNDAYCKYFGYKFEDLIGKKFLDFIPEEHREETKKQYLSLSPEQPQRSYNHEVIKDGKIKWQEWFDSAIFDKDGKAVIFQSIGIDITERKKIEIELTLAKEKAEESEQRLKDILLSMADWVWEIDAEGKYTYSSNKSEDFFQIGEDEILGKTLFNFMIPEEKIKLTPIINNLIKNRLPIHDLQNWNIDKFGKNVCFLTNALPIFDNKGEFAGYRGVNKDITEQIILNEYLFQAKEQAEKSNLQISAMLNSIPDLVFRVDKNGTILDYKADNNDLYYNKNQIIGNKYSDMLPPNITNIMNHYIQITLETNTNQTFEYELDMPNQGLRNYEARMSKSGDSEITAIIRDITENKLKDIELQKEKEKTQEILNKLKESEERLKLKLDYILSADYTPENIKLTDLIDLDLLQKIQDNFSNATGVASVITDLEGKPITIPSNFSGVCKLIRKTEKGRQNCYKSDKTIGLKAIEQKKPSYEKCFSCGFIDAGAPIIIAGKQLAIWMIGQSNIGEVNKQRIKDYSIEIGADTEQMLAEYEKMQNMSIEQFERATNFLWILAQEISNLAFKNISLAKNLEERKRYEKELIISKNIAEENERRLLTFINTIPDIVCYKDGEGKWLLANDADLELFCLKGVDYYGKTDIELADFTNEIYKQAFLNCVESDEKAWERKIITKGIEKIKNIYGEVKTYDIYKIPVFTKDGQRKGLAVIGRDITELYETQNKLIEAKIKAEESDKLKTAFIQNLSHEIRTPLNAICGFSEYLNEPELSDEKKNTYVNIIQSSSNQLLSIVSDILTISSLETKQEKVNISVVCINNIIMDIITMFKPQIKNPEISLYASRDLNDKQSTIYTDKTKVIQILTNLLSNALKFTHQGFIKFGYKLKVENQNPMLEFFVIDSGIGIKKEFHEKIFERFRQAEKSTNQIYGGTGLGLSISKGFVELLDGKIWVQSELDKGASFFFTIPYNPVDENTEINTLVLNTQESKKILVAEDEEYNFLYVEELLKKLEFKIIHAKNGFETVELFKSNPDITLILMDIKMPFMNGHEAAVIIKEINPNVPIIAQSAYALEHERAMYGDIFDDYLIKPIKASDLSQKILQYYQITSK